MAAGEWGETGGVGTDGRGTYAVSKRYVCADRTVSVISLPDLFQNQFTVSIMLLMLSGDFAFLSLSFCGSR